MADPKHSYFLSLFFSSNSKKVEKKRRNTEQNLTQLSVTLQTNHWVLDSSEAVFPLGSKADDEKLAQHFAK